jgi:hypothetical protein
MTRTRRETQKGGIKRKICLLAQGFCVYRGEMIARPEGLIQDEQITTEPYTPIPSPQGTQSTRQQVGFKGGGRLRCVSGAVDRVAPGCA